MKIPKMFSRFLKKKSNKENVDARISLNYVGKNFVNDASSIAFAPSTVSVISLNWNPYHGSVWKDLTKQNEALEKKPLENGGTLLNYVTSYRNWKLIWDKKEKHLLLGSTVIGHVWVPDIPEEARHGGSLPKRQQLEIPELAKYKSSMIHDFLNCECGIYSRKDRAFTTGGQIRGSVACWGRVIEYTDGYKSQYGYPLSIDSTVCESCNTELNHKDNLVHLSQADSDIVFFMCEVCASKSGMKVFYCLGDVFDFIAKTYSIENHLLDGKDAMAE